MECDPYWNTIYKRWECDLKKKYWVFCIVFFLFVFIVGLFIGRETSTQKIEKLENTFEELHKKIVQTYEDEQLKHDLMWGNHGQGIDIVE